MRTKTVDNQKPWFVSRPVDSFNDNQQNAHIQIVLEGTDKQPILSFTYEGMVGNVLSRVMLCFNILTSHKAAQSFKYR